MSLPPASPPRRRGRPRRLAAATAAGTVLALALAGCGTMHGASTSTTDSGANGSAGSGAGEITTTPVAKRVAAPDISGTTLDGKRLALSDYSGKIIVLNVWGSWCDMCRAEAANLAKVAKETAGQDVQFIGIDVLDPGTAQGKGFDRKYGITYPSFYNQDSSLTLRFPPGTFTANGIPNTVILDRHHRIAVRALKALTVGELRGALDPIIAEK